MSDYDKPESPNVNFEIPTMDEIKEKARKAQESLQNPPTITDKQKAILLTLGVTYVLFRIEKRMVKKVVRKELIQALTNIPVRIDLQSYMADLDVYDAAQRAAWLSKHPY